MKKKISLALLCLICGIGFSPDSTLFAQVDQITPSTFIDNRIDVHAQRSLYRLVKGNPAEQVVAADLYNGIQEGKIKGIYVVDQGVPALRAKSINSAWWLTIPKGKTVAVMDEPQDSLPLVALAKWILPNSAQVDQALIQAWKTLLEKKSTPTPNSSKTSKIPGFIPIPELTKEEKDHIERVITDWMKDIGWPSEDEEIIKQRFGLEGGE